MAVTEIKLQPLANCYNGATLGWGCDDCPFQVIRARMLEHGPRALCVTDQVALPGAPSEVLVKFCVTTIKRCQIGRKIYK